MRLQEQSALRQQIRTRDLAIVLMLLMLLLYVVASYQNAMATPTSSYTPPTSITVTMYQLDPDDGDNTYIPCSFGNAEFGCTADPDHPYPYTSNRITVPIETDYLLDVVPCEMDPYNFPNLPALQAQAIAARTYAYWHIKEQHTINNSRDFQVFVPYKFDTLPPSHQTLTWLAVDPTAEPKRYLSRPDEITPTFIMYFDDIPGRTKRDPNTAHLWDVPDPISTACDAYTRTVNGYGMSQRDANRWVRGQQCSYDGATVVPGNPAGGPWRLSWSRPEQILAHYYRAVEFRGFSPSVPSYHRWNVLDHNIPATLLVGGTQAVGMWVQNASVATWEFRAEDVQLPQIKCYWYREDGSAAGLGSTYQLTGAIAPSEANVYWFYLASPATPGTYFLRCDMGRYEYDHDQHVWVWKSFYVSGWPMQEKTVSIFPATYHLYLPLALRPSSGGMRSAPSSTLPAYPPPPTPGVPSVPAQTATPLPPPPTMPPLMPGPLTDYQAGAMNVNHNWITVTFPAPFYEPPALLVTIMTENEGDTADVDVRNLTQHGFEVRVEEDTRAGWDGTHATETLAWFAVAQPSLSHQAGLAMVNHNWTTVHFATPFSVPPVLQATIASEFESDTAHVDVRNVTAIGFQVRVEEDPRAGWDGMHTREAVAWFAATTPPVGCQIGKANANHNWTTVTFPTPFALAPQVQATIMTNNEGDTVRVDVRNVTTTSFQVRVEEDRRAGWNGRHTTETVGWLACYP